MSISRSSWRGDTCVAYGFECACRRNPNASCGWVRVTFRFRSSRLAWSSGGGARAILYGGKALGKTQRELRDMIGPLR